jgi:hypothetical protein
VDRRKNKGGRPPTGRTARLDVTVDPHLKARFFQYCRARGSRPCLVMDQMLTELLATAEDPELIDVEVMPESA